MAEVFTRNWKRANHVVNPTEDASTTPFVDLYSCLVCGVYPATKKCRRCQSAMYCSVACQSVDHTQGRHTENCKLVAKLFTEKSRLEELLSRVMPAPAFSSSTSPTGNGGDFDEGSHTCGDDVPPIVGQLWKDFNADTSRIGHESPAAPLQLSISTQYCLCLLKLVQLLGRGESWRVKKLSYHPTVRDKHQQQQQQKQQISNVDNNSNEDKTVVNDEGKIMVNTVTNHSLLRLNEQAGNPLALSRGIEIALDLLHLDRIDMRVRHCIPSMFIELDQLQHAYDYCKFWLLPSSTYMLESLMQGEDVISENETFLHLQHEDMWESVSSWADFQSFYPSIGMAFEMALVKLKLADQAKRSTRNEFTDDSNDDSHSRNLGLNKYEKLSKDMLPAALRRNDEKLEDDARLLLSCVHEYNPYIIPPMAAYNANAEVPGTTPPAGVKELLNFTPGIDLQYKMGNAGAGSKEEAIGIWQKDMVIWDNDRNAMKFLSEFAVALPDSLVALPKDNGRAAATAKAQNLVEAIKKSNPSVSADQVMMHPEMAKLMLEHLQEARGKGDAC